MALTLTEIRKLKPSTLTIIKKCQLLGTPVHYWLTNCTNSVWSTCPVQPDPSLHLNPNDQIELLDILEASKDRNSGYDYVRLLARNSNGIEFTIHAKEIRRFLAL